MPLTNCPVCDTSVSKEAKTCPKCGHPLKETAQGMSGCSLFILIVGAIVAAVILLNLGC